MTSEPKVEGYNREEYLAQVTELVEQLQAVCRGHGILQITDAILNVLRECYEVADEQGKMIIRGGFAYTEEEIFGKDEGERGAIQ